MGTNFYLTNGDITIHIGKRSAAGLFCWDCGLSLHPYGHNELHSGRIEFLESCSVCGNVPINEDLSTSAAGRELGFNKTEPKPKQGICSGSSFSWAITPEQFSQCFGPLSPILRIEDEYGREYSRSDFSKVLSECPIKYFDSIGVEFC